MYWYVLLFKGFEERKIKKCNYNIISIERTKDIKKLEKNMELKRNYSLDLLKIVSIIFVIILHYNNGKMGGLLANTQPGTSNYFIARFTEILTIIACNLFVLISGYFLCKSNKIKIRKIVDIVKRKWRGDRIRTKNWSA